MRSQPDLRGRSRRRVASRRGVMLILAGFLIFVLCGFAAFAIDMGFISLTQAQLQNACDAAALAAILELKTGQAADRDALEALARDTALYAASLNYAAGRSVVLEPTEVVFGNRMYDGGSGFTNTFPAADGAALNAVQVSCSFDEAAGPRAVLDLWFARMINHQTAAVSGASNAFMSPRDLVFVIDISNSMNDDTYNNASKRADIIHQMLPTTSGITAAMMDGGSNATRFQPQTPYSNTSGSTTNINLTYSSTTNAITTGNISSVNVSGVNRVRVTYTNHNLINDDVINIDKATGTAQVNIIGNWRVEVINDNQFYLKQIDSPFNYLVYPGGTYTASPSIRWRPHAVFKNTAGGIRVRIPDPTFATAGHGLTTGSLLKIQAATPTSLNAIYQITRVGGPSHAKTRYDMDGSTFGSTAWTLNSGNIRVPHYGTDTLTTAQRTRLLRQIWLMHLDSNGSYPNVSGSGINYFGSVAAAEEFAAYEFPSGQTDANYESTKPFGYYTAYDSAGPDPLLQTGPAYNYPNGHPWLHWKWRAYVNAIYGRGYSFDLNVISAPGGNYFNYDRYARFILNNGYVPALRGQQVWGRDVDMNGTLDTIDNGTNPPPSSLIAANVRSTAAYATYTDYPDYGGFYSKPAYLKDYSPAGIDFTEGSPTAGIHPLNIADEPFTYVRQATLNGINAMISDENAGNAAFDQVSMVTFGTRAYLEFDLTNDVDQAIIDANNRLAVTGSNESISPAGNGRTNFGGAIRMAYHVLNNEADATMGVTFTKGRSFANKVMALLTDGNPNLSPAGGYEAPEYTAGTDTINWSDASGPPYGYYWANKCNAEKIVIHTICVGDGANPTTLANISSITGGQAFVVEDPAADVDQLNAIFIAIGKDKIGKLYGN